jgi:DNA-binding MarR family transcriptional regulator
MIDHPTSGIDETVHQRHRLGILTITAEADRAEFGYLREALDLTPGNLSRHLTVLEDAGLVNVEKGYDGRRPRTWIRITREGRTALAAELDLLDALVRQHAVVARRTRSRRDGDGAAADSARAADSVLAADSAPAADTAPADGTPQSDHEPGSGDGAPESGPG